MTPTENLDLIMRVAHPEWYAIISEFEKIRDPLDDHVWVENDPLVSMMLRCNGLFEAMRPMLGEYFAHKIYFVCSHSRFWCDNLELLAAQSDHLVVLEALQAVRAENEFEFDQRAAVHRKNVDDFERLTASYKQRARAYPKTVRGFMMMMYEKFTAWAAMLAKRKAITQPTVSGDDEGTVI